MKTEKTESTKSNKPKVRNRRLQILCTDEEFAAFKKAARLYGMTTSAWLRLTARKSLGLFTRK